MQSVTDGVSLARALDSPIHPELKNLLTVRCDQLGGEIAGHARFLILEKGNTLQDLEAELGWALRGDAERSFLPEWVADHGHVLEAVWLLTDDGYAHVAWVPRLEGMDPELIEYCATCASQDA